MRRADEVGGWLGYRVDDVFGTRVGVLHEIYCDRESGAPVWMLVRAGRALEAYHAVPLARVACGNERVWVPYTRRQVLASGRIALARPVSPLVEGRLCRHYAVKPTRGAKLAPGERRSALVSLTQLLSAAGAGGHPPREPSRIHERRRPAPDAREMLRALLGAS